MERLMIQSIIKIKQEDPNLVKSCPRKISNRNAVGYVAINISVLLIRVKGN